MPLIFTSLKMLQNQQMRLGFEFQKKYFVDFRTCKFFSTVTATLDDIFFSLQRYFGLQIELRVSKRKWGLQLTRIKVTHVPLHSLLAKQL